MALAALSAENRIKSRLNELGATADFLSSLDGQISGSRLSQALRGLRPLEHRDSERLLALTTRLMNLRDCFGKVPVAFSSAVVVREMLNSLSVDDETLRQTIVRLFQ
jgi:hypothetical protein